MKSKYPFVNKVVWITGASSGIGEALCYEFAKNGALLILSARNQEKLKAVQEKLPQDSNKSQVLAFDLEELDGLKDKVQLALSLFGRIDYFISNAGIAIKDFALSTPLAIDQKLMKINYFSSIAITKFLLPHFIERNSGHLVVTSSLSGKYGVPKIAAYAASKHALHGFYETLRSEIANYDIDLTIVIPGIIKTEITAHALTGTGEKFGKVDKTFQNAYPPDRAAQKIISAVLNKKESVFVGGSEGITLILNRISPWLLRRFIRNHPIKKMRKLKRSLGLKE